MLCFANIVLCHVVFRQQRRTVEFSVFALKNFSVSVFLSVPVSGFSLY